MEDLHELPKFRDQLSYLYIEHSRIDQHEKSIAFYNEKGMVPVPVASLAVLMLGPGTDITHSAIKALAENNCLVIWCGEENVRFYSYGTGGTRGSLALCHQAAMASDNDKRLEVVKRMYRMRFAEELSENLTIPQLRGMEGIRVRKAYSDLSKQYGVPWNGRSYDRGNWKAADPINRAISTGNACLYGLCHAAILSAGYSPAIGFIHCGKQLSFVYDIADLYKVDIVLPLAFSMVTQPNIDLERSIRMKLRDVFRETKLLKRIIPDIFSVLAQPEEPEEVVFDSDSALPSDLWEGPHKPDEAIKDLT
jgi:CRISPR-associated protein Cas1